MLCAGGAQVEAFVVWAAPVESEAAQRLSVLPAGRIFPVPPELGPPFQPGRRPGSALSEGQGEPYFGAASGEVAGVYPTAVAFHYSFHDG